MLFLQHTKKFTFSTLVLQKNRLSIQKPHPHGVKLTHSLQLPIGDAVMIKAVIFDLDGTISDTISTITHYCNVTLKHFGFEPLSESVIKYYVGDGKKKLVHRFLAHYNADTPEMFEKAEKKYDSEYESDVIFDTKPFDGICAVLKKIRQNGIKTAVLSNKPDNVSVMIVEKLFCGLFDVYHGKRDGVETKPNPHGAFLTAEELGVKPSECVFVGDTNVDIKTAKNAHMYSVGVLWGFRDIKELLEAGADYIAHDPKELSDIILNKIK